MTSPPFWPGGGPQEGTGQFHLALHYIPNHPKTTSEVNQVDLKAGGEPQGSTVMVNKCCGRTAEAFLLWKPESKACRRRTKSKLCLHVLLQLATVICIIFSHYWIRNIIQASLLILKNACKDRRMARLSF